MDKGNSVALDIVCKTQELKQRTEYLIRQGGALRRARNMPRHRARKFKPSNLDLLQVDLSGPLLVVRTQGHRQRQRGGG